MKSFFEGLLAVVVGIVSLLIGIVMSAVGIIITVVIGLSIINLIF